MVSIGILGAILYIGFAKLSSVASINPVIAVFLRVGIGQVVQLNVCVPLSLVALLPLHTLHLEMVSVLDVRCSYLRLRQLHFIHRIFRNHICYPMLCCVRTQRVCLCLVHSELLQIRILDILQGDFHIVGKERFPIQPDLMNHTVPIGELTIFIPQSWHTAHQVEQHRSSRHLKSIHIKHRCVATLIHPFQLSDNHDLIHTHRIAFQYDAVEIYRPTSAITLIVFIKVVIRQLQVLRVCFISHIRHLHRHSGHIVLLHTLLQHIHSMKKMPVLIRHRHRLHRRIVQAHQLDVCTWKRIRLGIHLICTVYATGYV